MRQLRTYSQRVVAEDVIGRNILEARASQAIMLHGYKIDLTMVEGTTWTSVGERIELAIFLQANPLAPLSPTNHGTEALDTLVKHRGNIGVHLPRWSLRGEAGAAEATRPFLDCFSTTGWIPCEFLVPGLWMVGSSSAVGNVSASTALFHILFDWITMSPMQIAALYTTWGFDPVDATEKEASGEIDFSKAVGDGVKPPFIG